MNLLRQVFGVAALLAGVHLAVGQELEVNDTLPPPSAGKTWKLVWHDEFDGPTLDERKWEIPPDGARRKALWLKKAVALDGQGHLVISTLQEGDKYAGGCIRTRGKYEHAFGYYVARIQLQKETGHWPAFWLHNDCVSTVGNEGRDGTEIDIMEKFFPNDWLDHALHWDGYGKDHRTKVKRVQVPGIREGWHTYSVLWLPEEYVFYVDGRETWRTTAGGVCQVPLYIKLTDEVGPWAGDITRAKLPDRFLTDYVRVYDLADKP
jgi:beta-glucanase (GH16 family)